MHESLYQFIEALIDLNTVPFTLFERRKSDWEIKDIWGSTVFCTCNRCLKLYTLSDQSKEDLKAEVLRKYDNKIFLYR